METYIVKEGDNIATIAKKYNISIVDLINQNNLENVYYLEPGLELIIPEEKAPLGFTHYTVKKGDNLYEIAKRYNISVKDLSELNGLEINEYIYPEQRLLVPEEGVQVYITKDGDTIQTIIDKLGTNREEIFVYNPKIYLLPEQLIAYRKRNEPKDPEKGLNS
ncbi:MAG TPA: LysM peptidoglycan-binding domain-containing protein [Candidatus Scybalousia intestinigallinarum]|jgi:peptidoglycan-binding lysM|nr:LysM peptidoglycan-binding domain-containing protein [Candidatus Scybalousia intestinigallinarum]